MLPIITVLSVLQSLPGPGPGSGPLDAFRANYASIKVDVQYQYTFGPADPKVLNRFWSPGEPEYDESAGPDRWLLSRWGIRKGEVAGGWSCDGSSEHYHYASPVWMFKMAREHNGGQLPNPFVDIFPQRDGVCDGSTWVEHQVFPQNDGRIVRPRGLTIHDPETGGSMRLGPFVWCRAVYSFPQLLETQAAGSKLERRTSQRDGHPVEVEIYKYDPPEASTRLSRIEISYDPAIGYLPRFFRQLYRSEDDEAHVVEMYLITARPCAAGGFVPTEWHDTFFKVSGFSRRYPKYDDDTVLEPTERVDLGHFRVTDFKDRSAPIALNVKNINGIYMPGSFASFPAGMSSLTMPELKAFIHSKSRKSRGPSLPNLGGGAARGSGGPTLDAEELNELKQFAQQSPRRWSWYLILPVLIVLVASLVAWRRASARVLSLVLLCWGASGCSQQVQLPVARLSADFAPNHILLDNEAHLPPLKLMVRNTGDQPLRLDGVDGGCSCRKIDQSKLPTVLAPGNTLPFDVEFASNAQTSTKGFAITFQTDRGSLHVPVSLLALPAHQIDPSTFLGNLQEGQEDVWEVELVHRAVFRGDEPKPVATLEVPPEFLAVKIGSQVEPADQAPDLQFEDVTYRITLQDQHFGMGKAFLTLRGAQGGKLVEAPVAWRRQPFLSTTPDRVILGVHPVRVFLRCPVEQVELTRVIAKPSGINAVVSSIRELTVMLDDDAPDVIDGQIEVGTTAPKRPSLKIPVVRYHPTRQTVARQGGPRTVKNRGAGGWSRMPFRAP